MPFGNPDPFARSAGCRLQGLLARRGEPDQEPGGWLEERHLNDLAGGGDARRDRGVVWLGVLGPGDDDEGGDPVAVAGVGLAAGVDGQAAEDQLAGELGLEGLGGLFGLGPLLGGGVGGELEVGQDGPGDGELGVGLGGGAEDGGGDRGAAQRVAAWSSEKQAAKPAWWRCSSMG